MATNHYEIPNWAGKPPTGLHLDVLKGERLVQKLMLDQKKCYFFGRNQELCDFSIDHQSCSRVHAVFVYHKFLDKGFLVDLGSTHGTFIGNMRIDAHKPTVLPIDSKFHFGHSTRLYVLRARPQMPTVPIMEELEHEDEKEEMMVENEMALDNITEYNTAQNRRITLIGINERNDYPHLRRKHYVSFNEDDEIINPEDVDPNVGRFRNLVHSTIVPAKRPRPAEENIADEPQPRQPSKLKHPKGVHYPATNLYYDMPASHDMADDSFTAYSSTVVAKLGLPIPNPAPDVDADMQEEMPVEQPLVTFEPEAPRKKKYAKEAWPGKKPSLGGMLM